MRNKIKNKKFCKDFRLSIVLHAKDKKQENNMTVKWEKLLKEKYLKEVNQMKKLKVIGAVGLCAVVIGGTVMVTKAVMPEQKVIIHETDEAKMSKKSGVEDAQKESPSAVPQEEQPDSTAIPQEEQPASIVTSQEETSAIQEKALVMAEPQEEQAASTMAPQQETPAVQQQEVINSAVIQEPYAEPSSYDQVVCPFVDENHDGFCDYGDVHHHNGSHMDTNCDGICDYGDRYCMQSHSDADGDGVCDNYQSGVHHSYGGSNSNGNNASNGTSANPSSNAGYGTHHSERHHGGGHHR